MHRNGDEPLEHLQVTLLRAPAHDIMPLHHGIHLVEQRTVTG